MINTLKMSLRIDMTYAINSFIYSLKRLPVFKNLLTDDIYKSKKLKAFVRILAIIFSSIRFILYRLFYFFAIYFVANMLYPNSLDKAFIHIYFICAVIGIFINNKLLVPDTKKYFSIILFQVDAKKYMKAMLFWIVFIALLFNFIGFFILSKFINLSWEIIALLLLFSFFCRVIGESFSIWFYKRYHYLFESNYKLLFGVVITLISTIFLGYIPVFLSIKAIIFADLLFSILAVVSYFYLKKLEDYKLLFKRLNSDRKVFNKDQQSAYSRQAMVQVRNQDKEIDSRKLTGKSGYELFNTIFFERHKYILLRSAIHYSIGILLIILLLSIFVTIFPTITSNINTFLLTHLGWFVFIMYFINRGAIITQAMFYNCDHAMLTYNFYREPKVLLGLFKKRLLTVVKVNLIPASIIAFGVVLLLYLSGGSSIVNYITIPVFILVLNVFFSVHHLVIYYLFQPYNKDMVIKSPMYTIISFAIYFISYNIKDLVVSSLTFSVIGLLFTITYIFIGLILVYKKAPVTFKLH